MASTVLAALVDLTPLHPVLLRLADHNELPFVGEMYEGIHTPREDRGMFRGQVLSIGTSTFTMAHDYKDVDDELRVIPPPGFIVTNLQPAENVEVVGDRILQTIQAYGVWQDMK